MMRNKDNSPVYGHDVMELVTVVVEFCVFLEQAEGKSRTEFVDTITKLLPLLYLKATLLPQYELWGEDYYPEAFVTEENYNIVRANICMVMGDRDDYLDVFVEDMKYSETPILMSVSENLADIYQELKNFVLNYRHSSEEGLKMDALAALKEGFECGWGQKVVNVLRVLHEVRYEVTEDM